MAADFTPTPIQANASPLSDQIASGIRQLLLVLATAATALGSVGWAGKFNALAIVAGPLAGLIVIILGQLRTRKLSQNVATMAAIVPNKVAVVVNK
jgi:hypothetical protein